MPKCCSLEANMKLQQPELVKLSVSVTIHLLIQQGITNKEVLAETDIQ